MKSSSSLKSLKNSKRFWYLEKFFKLENLGTLKSSKIWKRPNSHKAQKAWKALSASKAWKKLQKAWNATNGLTGWKSLKSSKSLENLKSLKDIVNRLSTECSDRCVFAILMLIPIFWGLWCISMYLRSLFLIWTRDLILSYFT